jgi:putative photosynthetic complex assembly protein
MTTQRDPRRGLVLLWAAVLGVLLAVSAARLGGYQPPAPEDTAVLDSRAVLFEDGAAGAVDVYASDDGRLLLRLEAGEGSFMRGVVRALVRERRSRDIDASAPFLLSRHSDGGLVLKDESTGRRIDLLAFGPANAGAFARLLAPGLTDT